VSVEHLKLKPIKLNCKDACKFLKLNMNELKYKRMKPTDFRALNATFSQLNAYMGTLDKDTLPINWFDKCLLEPMLLKMFEKKLLPTIDSDNLVSSLTYSKNSLGVGNFERSEEKYNGELIDGKQFANRSASDKEDHRWSKYIITLLSYTITPQAQQIFDKLNINYPKQSSMEYMENGASS
jgi:hypothetical protein